MSSYTTMLADLEAKIAANGAEQKSLQTKMKALRKKRTALIQKHLQDVDLESCSSEDFKAVMAEAWSEKWAHDKVEAWMAPAGKWNGPVSGDGWIYVDESMRMGFMAPKIMIQKDTDLGEAYAELCRILLRYKKVYRVKELHVGIFENTLSEFGIYHMGVTGARQAVLRKTTYGRTEDLQTGTLSKLLQYVQDHHWYGDPQPRSNALDDWDF